MRDFSQSLQGSVKKLFRHFYPESINTWEEFSRIFLDFWGERRSLDQILSEFYSMRKPEGEAMSSFNKRFTSFYYGMPKEIQPLEGAAKLHYAFVFPPDLSLFLLERKMGHHYRKCLLMRWRSNKILDCREDSGTMVILMKTTKS